MMLGVAVVLWTRIEPMLTDLKCQCSSSSCKFSLLVLVPLLMEEMMSGNANAINCMVLKIDLRVHHNLKHFKQFN